MQLVKLGGSVLTVKGDEPRLRRRVLRRMAVELAQAEGPLVVVHGAGSFGHPQAHAAGLREPGRIEAAAASHVHAAVRQLHQAVLEALDRAGAAPWSVPTATITRTDRGAVTAFDAGPVQDALDRGHVPVLMGDVVPDALGHAIVSGDVVMRLLAEALAPSAAHFVQAEAGFLVDGEVVHRVTRDHLEHAGASEGVDVTGGMATKVEQAFTIADLGVATRLVPQRSGALADALAGADVGSLFVPGPS